MKIKLKIKFYDVLIFTKYTYIRIPLTIVLFAIYVTLSSYVNLMDVLNESKTSIIVFKFLLFEARSILVMIGILIIILILSVISKKNKNYYIDQELTISEAGVIQKSKINKSELIWEGIQKISKTKSYIYLYVNQISAYIIPRRAFDHKNEWESFYSTLMKYSKRT